MIGNCKECKFYYARANFNRKGQYAPLSYCGLKINRKNDSQKRIRPTIDCRSCMLGERKENEQ